MHNNPFQCDERMEWMKLAVRYGWIQFQWQSTRGQPQCENFPGMLWEDVTLATYSGIINFAFIDEWKHIFIPLYMSVSNKN